MRIQPRSRSYGAFHTWPRRDVCRRRRYLILASSSSLGLCLVCKHPTPIAPMLAHSPPLLLIDHVDEHDGITSEDEEGILLALQHYDRIRRIRLMACSGFAEYHCCLRQGIFDVGIPVSRESDKYDTQLDPSRHLSSATATLPQAS